MAIKPSQYKILKPFEAWVQQTLPAIYDDSLSYTDLLSKLLYYVNTLAENNTTLSNDVTNAINYINNFFESKDFQDKVDDKLDRMASDGTLSQLIQPLFDAYKVQIDSIIDSIVETQNAFGFVTPEMFGAVGDGSTDDTNAIQNAINSGKSVLMWGKKYCISRKLLLPYSFNIRGLSKSSTVIEWIGGPCDYIAKTPDYSTRDKQNVYGSISDITFECKTNFMSNDTVGLYFCEPNVKLTDIIVRIGEEKQKEVNNNVIGIYLDGCTNASPSLLEKVSVHANANIGIYVCASHTTLIDCDTAYCKNGTVIDEDTLKTDANPPYNTVFIGHHSFYDLENAILINKAKNVYVQSIFAETSGAFIRGNDSFTGELIVDGTFQISYNKVNAKNASVIFRDLQNCVEYGQHRGVNSHPCYFSSFSSFAGEWGGQNGDWIIATTDKITNVVNIIDAYTEFIGNGSGNVTVDLCTSNIPKQIGNYSDDASVNIIATKTFNASESPKLEQIHFILGNQQYTNKYIFVRLRCSGYYTNSAKQLVLHICS